MFVINSNGRANKILVEGIKSMIHVDDKDKGHWWVEMMYPRKGGGLGRAMGMTTNFLLLKKKKTKKNCLIQSIDDVFLLIIFLPQSFRRLKPINEVHVGMIWVT